MQGLAARSPAPRQPAALAGVFTGPPGQRRSPSAAEVLVGIRNRAMMASRVA